jgi:hypothetical protein
VAKYYIKYLQWRKYYISIYSGEILYKYYSGENIISITVATRLDNVVTGREIVEIRIPRGENIL